MAGFVLHWNYTENLSLAAFLHTMVYRKPAAGSFSACYGTYIYKYRLPRGGVRAPGNAAKRDTR
ncbi:hypothetical protein EBB54_16350 [Schaedlerella arabinosiphila]|uniref:Uncharacterized protein n=1 Tax=Schaedlerella arabinosiphila TaxID=2044587 RepID=A0A426DJE9_9FIRM|nr:hypothetical protein EBB54_16350 [Schaedlerella arabinosiphila]